MGRIFLSLLGRLSMVWRNFNFYQLILFRNIDYYCTLFACILFQLHFHGKNYKELQDYIDVEHLPSDYGGKGPPYTNQVWYHGNLSYNLTLSFHQKYFEYKSM